MEWTTEQQTAIDFRGGSAIVSAAAGSGKTAVLVERVIKLLLDEENKTEADKLVIATFTEKAAGELQTRLQRALNDAVAHNPDNTYLKAQRTRLEDASVSTISSFCMKLIRENSAFLGISPDFSVIDEAEGRLLFIQSMDNVLERFYSDESGDEEKTLMYDWYGGEDDSELCEAVSAVYNLAKKLPYPWESMKKWQEIYDNPLPYRGGLLSVYKEICIKPAALEMAELLPRSIEAWDDGCTPCLSSWKRFIAIILKLCGENDPFFTLDESCTIEDALTVDIIPPKRASKNYDNTVQKAAHDELTEMREKLIPVLTAVTGYEENMKECAPVLKILTRLAKETDKEFSDAKRSKNKIDFTDAETFALELLSDENAAREIRKGVSVIIVDEFQDSNDIQYEIFRRLSDNGQNLYFVGDIKQSIYRFRGANPAVFTQITEDDNFTNIYLNKNFRSSEKIINSVNGIFEKTMTKALGEVDYDENAQLVLGAEQYKTDETRNTELIRVHGAGMPEAREREAAYIADRIKEMVESGFEVTEKDGTRRPCGYGDFAVLMGKYRTNLHLYKKALVRAGIPFEAKEDGAFTDYYEIKLLLSLLRVIDNPYHDISLAALLILPPYSFTPDMLADIKQKAERRKAPLYSCLRSYARENSEAALFCGELNILREFASEHSVEQLIRYIYDESRIISAVQAMPDGDKRDSNLKLMISYARRFSENGLKGLYDFLSYMDMVSRGDISLAQAKGAEAAGGSVKLMTIHGSKGLEFPITFVSNLSSDRKSKGSGKINTDIKYGAGMRAVRHKEHLIIDTFMYNLIEKTAEMQELSEEMRLLYVAATRAKEKLIFTAPLGGADKHKVHLRWVEASVAAAKGLIEISDLYGYEAVSKKDGTEDKKQGAQLKPFSQYAYLKYSEIPAKVTATQVGVKRADEYSETVNDPKLFLKNPTFVKKKLTSKLTGKRKGDAYHKAMELMDFAGDISQLDILYSRGKLTERERKCIDTAEIKAFLDSGLCARIVKSGSAYKEFPIFCEYRPDGFDEGEEMPFVQGIADLYFIEDGEIVLVDYKTNKNTDPAVLREEYEGQLRIYAKALERMTARRVKECYLWAFTAKTAIKVEI